MNASQLRETTLDPNARTLLKVEIKDSDGQRRPRPPVLRTHGDRSLCFNVQVMIQ